MKKKILFIPSYIFLSSDVYTGLLPKLEDFETIYLDVEDQYQSTRTTKEFKEQFTKHITLKLETKEGAFSKIKNFFILYKYQRNLQLIIEDIKPDIVIAASDIMLSTRIIKKYFPDIPIAIVQVSPFLKTNCSVNNILKIKYIIFNKIFGLCFFPKQKCYMQEYADTHLFLWGEYFNQLVENSHDRSKIKLVGNVKFDKLASLKNDTTAKKLFFQKNSIHGFSSVVTICSNSVITSITEEVILAVLNLYKKIIAKNRDIFFIVKPHPRENLSKIKEIFESPKIKNLLISTNELYDIYRYTDVQMSAFSTTSTEAFAAGIPTIIVNPDSMIDANLHGVDMREYVTNFSELNDTLHKLLDTDQENNYLKNKEEDAKKLFYNLDGKASDRITTEIKKILDNNIYNTEKKI